MKACMYSGLMSLMRDQGVDFAANYAKEAGFDSVELIEILKPDRQKYEMLLCEDRLDDLRNAFEKRELPISCFSVALSLYALGADLTCPSPMTEPLLRMARFAKALGAPYFHHTVVLNCNRDVHARSLPYERIRDYLIENACRVADACNRLGMTVLYEPQGYYINGIEQFGDFYYAVKAKGVDVGVCGDVGNTLFADTPPTAFFETYAHEMRHVHFKDYQVATSGEHTPNAFSLQGTGLCEVPLGTGIVDFDACMKLLRAVGYHGAISLEGSFHPLKEIAQYRQDVAFLRQCLS